MRRDPIGSVVSGLPSAARSFIFGWRRSSVDALNQLGREALEECYGILWDLFEHHGLPSPRARLLAIHAFGDLDHYVAHLATRSEPPLGINYGQFLDDWLDQWSGAFDVPN